VRQRVCDEQHVQEHEARRVIGLAEDGRGDADGAMPSASPAAGTLTTTRPQWLAS